LGNDYVLKRESNIDVDNPSKGWALHQTPDTRYIVENGKCIVVNNTPIWTVLKNKFDNNILPSMQMSGFYSEVGFPPLTAYRYNRDNIDLINPLFISQHQHMLPMILKHSNISIQMDDNKLYLYKLQDYGFNIVFPYTGPTPDNLNNAPDEAENGLYQYSYEMPFDGPAKLLELGNGLVMARYKNDSANYEKIVLFNITDYGITIELELENTIISDYSFDIKWSALDNNKFTISSDITSVYTIDELNGLQRISVFTVRDIIPGFKNGDYVVGNKLLDHNGLIEKDLTTLVLCQYGINTGIDISEELNNDESYRNWTVLNNVSSGLDYITENGITIPPIFDISSKIMGIGIIINDGPYKGLMPIYMNLDTYKRVFNMTYLNPGIKIKWTRGITMEDKEVNDV
jgi:hypothetical protein